MDPAITIVVDEFTKLKQKLEEAETELGRLRKLERCLTNCTSLEPGWHGNPDNHTLGLTLYFGSRDPRGLMVPDGRGNYSLSRELIDFWLKGKS